MKISVLCVDPLSNYFKLNDSQLDLWTPERDAYKYPGGNPVITHAPCQQWSRMKGFAKNNEREKMLAFHCLEQVHLYGGIFEHPANSSFFDAAGIKPTIRIDQHWFGFPAPKRTDLYFHKCRPVEYPLNFDAPASKVHLLNHRMRSRMTESFCTWLIRCVRLTLERG